MHFVSSILIAGIGVDYGIFAVNAYRDNYDENALNTTFQSIFIAALASLAGFGVLSFCRYYSLFSLGTSMAAGIIMSFITTYFALPFLLKERKKTVIPGE